MLIHFNALLGEPLNIPCAPKRYFYGSIRAKVQWYLSTSILLTKVEICESHRENSFNKQIHIFNNILELFHTSHHKINGILGRIVFDHSWSSLQTMATKSSKYLPSIQRHISESTDLDINLLYFTFKQVSLLRNVNKAIVEASFVEKEWRARNVVFIFFTSRYTKDPVFLCHLSNVNNLSKQWLFYTPNAKDNMETVFCTVDWKWQEPYKIGNQEFLHWIWYQQRPC